MAVVLDLVIAQAIQQTGPEHLLAGGGGASEQFPDLTVETFTLHRDGLLNDSFIRLFKSPLLQGGLLLLRLPAVQPQALFSPARQRLIAMQAELRSSTRGFRVAYTRENVAVAFSGVQRGA